MRASGLVDGEGDRVVVAAAPDKGRIDKAIQAGRQLEDEGVGPAVVSVRIGAGAREVRRLGQAGGVNLTGSVSRQYEDSVAFGAAEIAGIEELAGRGVEGRDEGI